MKTVTVECQCCGRKSWVEVEVCDNTDTCLCLVPIKALLKAADDAAGS